MKKKDTRIRQGTYEFKGAFSSLLIAIFALLISSCSSRSFSTEKDLLSYLNDEMNGYSQTKSVNGYDFSIMYRPTDLLVKQELEDKKVTQEEVEKLREKYKKYLYFNVSMSGNNKELLSTAVKNRSEFGAMVNQLAFGMNEKVHLFTQSKDTIAMADFSYTRMFGMSKATTILFVYPREKTKSDDDMLNLTIEDLGLYTGEVKFKIDTDKINNEPQLLFKTE